MSGFQSPSSAAPVKPWERNRGSTSSSSLPGAPPKPWEQPAGSEEIIALPSTSSTSQPSRPWESGAVSTSDHYAAGGGLYGTSSPCGRGSLGYGSSSMGGTYGGGLYGASGGMYGMSRGMYGGLGGMGSMYGSGMGGMYGGGSMYGSSMYGSGIGGMYGGSSMYGGGLGGMGGYGMGGMYGGGLGGPMMGPGGPYDPMTGPPPAPPTAWQTMLSGINGIMMFFGRLSFLVDENAHAVHFFISALLQLLDRAGSLYGEIARFVLRVIFRRKMEKPVQAQPGMIGLPGPAVPLALPGPLSRDSSSVGRPSAGAWESIPWGPQRQSTGGQAG